MPVETPSIFSKIIEEHLELKRRNAELEGDLPISRYVSDDPFHNHPLFKTEEQARLEETMDGSEPAIVPGAAVAASSCSCSASTSSASIRIAFEAARTSSFPPSRSSRRRAQARTSLTCDWSMPEVSALVRRDSNHRVRGG